ncbi:MAG: SMC-Scp complex subunit ScpB [Woeseia sp.]
MDQNEIKYFVEAALLAAGRPLAIDQIHSLFDPGSEPDKSQVRQAIADLQTDYKDRGIAVAEVASGFRMQVKVTMADRLQKLWEERPPRYSRALFETLALIAYRQPITRGEIEEIRGVSVSSNIIRTLLERDWVRVVGHRDVPGRPAMFGTTRLFLDYFGLRKLDDLPPLADLSDWESLRVQLNLPAVLSDDAEADVETADITDLPILFPEIEVLEGEASNESNDTQLPDMPPAEVRANTEFEEIVAVAWPDPGEVPVSVESDEFDDVDDASGLGNRSTSSSGR